MHFEWTEKVGSLHLEEALTKTKGILNLGCIAAHGYFIADDQSNKYDFISGGKPATAFLFKLISKLQFSGTVPMIYVLAYSKWI
jgi:hypothetical protein